MSSDMSASEQEQRLRRICGKSDGCVNKSCVQCYVSFALRLKEIALTLIINGALRLYSTTCCKQSLRLSVIYTVCKLPGCKTPEYNGMSV